MKGLKECLLTAVCVFMVTAGVSAGQSQEKKFDPSNAGNLYTQINLGAEFKRVNRDHNIYGIRINGQYAFNANNLILFEAPFLYNDQTRIFGISDLRVRYLSAVLRNMSKTFTFLIPFADISIPTGSFTDGLGSGRWSFGVGVLLGIRINNIFSLYPGLSYVYMTKDRVYLPIDDHSNGFSIQTNASVRLTKRAFVFINPIFSYSYTLNRWRPSWRGEVNLNYIIKPSRLKVNCGWYPDFTNKTHTFRLGFTFYLK